MVLSYICNTINYLTGAESASLEEGEEEVASVTPEKVEPIDDWQVIDADLTIVSRLWANTQFLIMFGDIYKLHFLFGDNYFFEKFQYITPEKDIMNNYKLYHI